MLRVVYMWEQRVNPRLELIHIVWERFVELIVEEHQVHNAIVRDYGFLLFS